MTNRIKSFGSFNQTTLTMNRIRVFGLIMLAAGFVISTSFGYADPAPQPPKQARSLRCTAAALRALKSTPKLDYECAERDQDNLKTDERRGAMKAYLQEIESTFADPAWWATSVDDLNICSMTKEARTMTRDERQHFLHPEEQPDLFGDQLTRLILNIDPCIRYSYNTLNAYVLQRVGGRVYATQVLDAYFSRADNSVSMELAGHNGERLILVETDTADGMMPPMPYMTYLAFAIDPRTHRAVPKKIFKKGRKLTNQLRVEGYVFSEEEDIKLSRKMRSTEIIRNGALSPRFYVDSISDHHLYRSTYTWNGRYYQRSR